MRKARLAISAAAAVLILVACGGGSKNIENPQQAEDQAASASISGLIVFAKAQIASFTSNSTEPRSIKGITPPTSDTAEPLPL